MTVLSQTIKLRKDTSSANNECLPGRVSETEDIIAADTVLLSARNVGVVRPTAHSDHNILRCQLLLAPVLKRRYNRVRVLELAQAIDILDFLIPKVDAGHPVHGLDVVLDGLCEGRPVDLYFVHIGDLPAVSYCLLEA